MDFEEREDEMSCLCLLLLSLQLLQHGLELLLLLLRLLDGRLVLLVVRHGHHGKDQVDQVEGAQEDHQHEEDHVGFPSSTQSLPVQRGTKRRVSGSYSVKTQTWITGSRPNLLVEVLPVVLGHESEEREEGPAEGVEAGVAVIWIPTRFHTREALWAEPVRTTLCIRGRHVCNFYTEIKTFQTLRLVVKSAGLY